MFTSSLEYCAPPTNGFSTCNEFAQSAFAFPSQDLTADQVLEQEHVLLKGIDFFI